VNTQMTHTQLLNIILETSVLQVYNILLINMIRIFVFM
jgi:hypothetical protein